MIAWSIKAAQSAGIFDRIIVSTDDDEISGVAKAHGAEAPFDRPASLADDFTATAPVIAHAIEELSIASNEVVCCLYATAPFVEPRDLVLGFREIVSGASDLVQAVTTFAYPLERALIMLQDGSLRFNNPSNRAKRSQDLNQYWHDAGQFYFAYSKYWVSHQSDIHKGIMTGVPVERYRVQDVDDLEDWKRAEIIAGLISAMSIPRQED